MVLKLFSESKVQMKIESIENLNFDKKEPRKFAKISTHKFPDLVSKVCSLRTPALMSYCHICGHWIKGLFFMLLTQDPSVV